jgi:hypothetical protein
MRARRGAPARQEGARSPLAAVLVLVLALALVASAAWARPPTDQERAALAATVSSFDAAMRDGNHARVAQTMPPKVLAAIARRANMTPDAVVAAMVKSMQNLQGNIESFGMDLGTAIHKELASGTPYLLIPTQTTMAVAGKRVQVTSHTLALLDEGRWYLLQVNSAPRVQILREVYPEFAAVEFPSGSTEMLNP